MALISVIVPVFNVEKYLRRCVDSILSQSFNDFELILINDGSKDESGKICDEYKEKDSRVIVFHYPNQGVSAARNHGLDSAAGDWVAFVDSDDYILPDYLQNMYDNAKKFDSNLVLSGIIHQFENDPNEIVEREFPEIVVDVSSLDELYQKGIMQYQKGPYIKLFQKNIIDKNQIRFEESLSRGEDALFVYSYLLCCSRVSVSSGVNYIYNRRHGSLMSQGYASYELENYGYECMKSILLQLIRKNNMKHPYPKDFLIYWFERIIYSIYSRNNNYSRKTRISFLNELDYQYYKDWKKPISCKERIMKYILSGRHFLLFDWVMENVKNK